jgi:hypothetical protein
MPILIITSTVYVNSRLTVLIDPEIRLKQYVDSIIFYLRTISIDAIIICDNSGFDYRSISELKTLAAKFNKRLEIHSFQGDEKKILQAGKGYGEGEMLRFIFEHSELLKAYDSFFKITGRVMVLNFDSIAKSINPDRIYFQKIRSIFLKDIKVADTRFYYCSKSVFTKYLINAFIRVNDPGGYYLEHAYRDDLDNNAVVFRAFEKLPIFDGVSGSHGGSLGTGKLTYVIKSFVNIIVRKFLDFKGSGRS